MSDVEHDEARGAGALLTAIADAEPVPRMPADALLRQGRRRLARRRVGLGLTAAAVVTATALGTTLLMAGADARTTDPAQRPTASAQPSRSPQAVRDPLTPSPIVTVATGRTRKDETWEVRARLWPVADTVAQGHKQLELMHDAYRDEHPDLAAPDLNSNPESGLTAFDHTEFWGVLDGERVTLSVIDEVTTVGMPSITAKPDGMFEFLLGYQKPTFDPPLEIGSVEADVGRLVARWSDGHVDEPALTRVGDSPVRWFALATRPGETAEVTLYAADGTVLHTTRDGGYGGPA